MSFRLSPFGGQQALVLETSKRAAHCFFRYAKVITDIATRHPQVKWVREEDHSIHQDTAKILGAPPYVWLAKLAGLDA